MLRRLRLIPALLLTIAAAAAEPAANPPKLNVKGFNQDAWAKAGYSAVERSESGNPVLETPSGRIELHRQHLLLGNLRPEDLPPLLAAHPKLPEQPRFELRANPLLGTYLAQGGTMLWTGGTLTAEVETERSQEADIAAIAKTSAALEKALPKLLPEDLARKSVAEVLKILVANGTSEAGDEADGPFARHLINHGWLEAVLGPAPAAKALTQAVQDAERMDVVQRFTGDGHTWETLASAYGRRGFLLRTEQSVKLMLPAAQPLMHGSAARNLRLTWLVLELKPGTPLSGAGFLDGLLSARHVVQGKEIFVWRPGPPAEFDINASLWRQLAPEPGRGYAVDYFPPHIAVQDVAGNFQALITAQGLLATPQPGEKDHERFLDEAAQQLPNAPHLDLIGQYLFRYIYDSPDPRVPFLVGSREVKGDIHQTANQTLSTATGGQCRGDCDDISEFYQAITERQGKLAHVISVPGHAALAWAEERDGQWHSFLLQTGPALEFTDADLGKSLGMIYSHFDENDTFDPDAVSLLLRFSGENTRSGWRLSSRIFRDRNYAETMIDVQRDWHYQTYLQGIQKMEKLIADGDQDNANHRELAGLAAFTGQYAKAAEYLLKARELTPEPINQLSLDVELAQHHFDGKGTEAGKKVVLDILDRQLPALKQQLGMGVIHLGIQLAGACIQGKQAALGARALRETTLPIAEQLLEQLDQVKARIDKDQWTLGGQIQQMRRIVSMTARTAISLLHEAGAELAATDPELQGLMTFATAYVDQLAFWDLDEASEAPEQYALAAILLELQQGSEPFMQAVTAAELPKKVIDWKKRPAGGDGSDLSWIAGSVEFWSGRIGQLYEKDRSEAPKASDLKDLGRRLDAAMAQQRKLGLLGNATEHSHHLAKLMVALGTQDEPGLRALLQEVKDRNDKRLRDDTAQTMGDCARLLDKAWFAKVLTAWQEVLDYKPKYYWIAWRAALAGAPEHALMTAKLAAERFKDDPAFVEEAAFMGKLLTK